MLTRSIIPSVRLAARAAAPLPRAALTYSGPARLVQISRFHGSASTLATEQQDLPAGMDKLISNPEALKDAKALTDLLKKAGLDVRNGQSLSITQMAKLAMNKDIRDATTKLASHIHTAGIDVEKLKEVLTPQKVQDLMEKFSQGDVKSAVASGAQKVQDAAKQAMDTAGNGTQQAQSGLNKAKSVMQSGSQQAQDAAQSGYEQAKNVAQNGTQQASETVKSGTNQAQEAVQAGKEQLNKAAAASKGQVNSAAQTIKETLQGATNAVKKTLSGQ